jgi:chemotaxis family two-component system sensor kinase Cph1
VAVGGFVQIAKRHLGPDPDPKAELCLDEALGGVKRMEALIEDLLAYSKAGAGAEPREPTGTDAALGEALANLRAGIEASGARVSFDPLPRVVGRHREIVQLFQNLVGNALKYRGTGSPRVHIGIERIGQEHIFFVRDDGPGIDPADAQRVFGLFQRLPAASQTPGTGIGLAVCKKIVESLGGRIWVDSRPGEGATFRFTLPLGEKG